MTPMQKFWKERLHLVKAAAAGKIVRIKGSKSSEWDDHIRFNLHPDNYEIIEPKLNIPWEYIEDTFKWATMDSLGQVRLFQIEPFITNDGKYEYWSFEMAGCKTPTVEFLGKALKQPKGIDWKTSKIKRPS